MRCLISSSGRLGTPPRLRRGRARTVPRPQPALRRQRRTPAAGAHHRRLAGRDGEREFRAGADCDRYLVLADQLDQPRRRGDLRVCPVAAPLRRFGCAADVRRHGLCLGLRQLLGRRHRFGRCSSSSWWAPAWWCCCWASSTSCWRRDWRRSPPGGIIALEFLVPRDTGLQPAWAQSTGFVITTDLLLRDDRRHGVVRPARHRARRGGHGSPVRPLRGTAGQHVAGQHRRAAQRARRASVIADKYDEASVLFADIVGFTERASSTAPGRPGAVPRPAVQRLRRAGGQARAGEDQGQRRLLHGGQRSSAAAARPRRGAGRLRPRDGRCRSRTEGSARPLGAAAGGHGHRPRGRGRRRFPAVLLRRVGRRGQCRVPDGIHRLGGAHSSARGRLPAPQGRLRAAGARPHRGQGQRHHAHLVSHRPQGGRQSGQVSSDLLADDSRTAHV